MNLGNALRSKGELEEAIAVYRQVAALAPRYAAAHEQLALALVQKGCLDEAIAEMRATTRVRNYVPDHILLGNMLARKGLSNEAIAAWKRAIELDPKDAIGYHRGSASDLAIAHYNLATALLEKKECRDEAIVSFRNAIACHRKAIELNPGDGSSRNNLAWFLATCAHVQLRDSAEAVKLAQKAVELAPGTGTFWNTLGAAHYRAGNWKEAIVALEKATQLRNGGDSYDWFFLAMAHWQLGEKDKARQWFDRAVQGMDKKMPKGKELGRFRAEAAELLKIEAKKK